MASTCGRPRACCGSAAWSHADLGAMQTHATGSQQHA